MDFFVKSHLAGRPLHRDVTGCSRPGDRMHRDVTGCTWLGDCRTEM